MRTNNLSLVLVLQTVYLEPLIFGFVGGLDKTTTVSSNFWFWSCRLITELKRFSISNNPLPSQYLLSQFEGRSIFFCKRYDFVDLACCGGRHHS